LIARLGRLTRANRVRRNHALEHATISVVTERHPSVFLRGRSTPRGFSIVGDIEVEELRSAIDEAQRRLRKGEAELAIHPRCGTNLAVAGVLSGISAALAAQLRPREHRFTYAVLASLAALMVSPALGTATQRHVTTLADLNDLVVDSIQPRRFFRSAGYWVKTRST
jgi:hypothetical protein